MSSPVALSVLWCVLVGRSDALHTGMLLPRATSPRLSSPLSMMATDTEGETAAGGEVAPAPVDPNAPVDLSAMTFEERLAYLSAQAPNEVPKKEEESSLFGIDAANTATQWFSPEFLSLCLADLKEMTWPSRKDTIQTIITSQIAFVVVIILVLVLDAFTESAVRTLIQGRPFEMSMDTILKRGGLPELQ